MDSVAAGDNTDPHFIRVASHGKISVLVTFALKFLKDNPKRPLILHTLPHECGTISQGEKTSAPELGAKTRKIEPATTNVPRLISVVEIIKREFKQGPLHQYNEVGCLDIPDAREEGPGVGVPDEPGVERQAALQKALGGKNHLPIQRMPYMKITLSQVTLSESVVQNTTYQPPAAKKPSRAARARNRRRVNKETAAEAGAAQEADDDAMDIVPT